MNENYLDTVDTDNFYLPNEIADGRGKNDAVKLLYEKANSTIKQKF